MKVEQFSFELPRHAIALRPSKPRDAARMLVVHADGSVEHRHVRDLPEYLSAPDVIVINDTKVLHARLAGRRLARSPSSCDAKIEVTLHKRLTTNMFTAFAKPGRKLSTGDRVVLGANLAAEVGSKSDMGEIELVFSASGNELDEAILKQGAPPLPPYIAMRRAPDRRDRVDYQTVFAREPGSVAAPTAGLHFTPELRNRLSALGVAETQLTLHVGGGTFIPVKVSDTAAHRMHSEFGSLSQETASILNRRRSAGGRILAVGTTSVRTLETASNQDGILRPFEGEIALFITPGYRFRATDILLTNFHLPRSTLFMLVSAFCGLERMKCAYQTAIKQGYRFYSYGDACLLFPAAS